MISLKYLRRAGALLLATSVALLGLLVTSAGSAQAAPGQHPALAPSNGGLVFKATITFNNGVPVGGWANLTINLDGSFNFSGHFHDSGATSYNVGFVWVFRTSAGTAFVFSDSGRVHGTFESGSRNHDWNVSGVNPAIAAAWPDIQQGWNWQWKAKTSLNLGGMFSEIAGTIGAIGTVIAVVGAVF